MPWMNNNPAPYRESSWLSGGTLLFSALLLMMSSSTFALQSDREQPINIVADTSEVDAKTGYTRITGGVVITQGSLNVNADEARVYVVDGKVNRVELDGRPATWKQQLDNGEDMNARALHIDYKVPVGIIELTGDALVNHPQGKISGASLLYELDTEKLRGFSKQNSNDNERIQITIEPSAVDDGGIFDGINSNDTDDASGNEADNGNSSAETDNGGGNSEVR